jgi:hypothetical protein
MTHSWLTDLPSRVAELAGKLGEPGAHGLQSNPSQIAFYLLLGFVFLWLLAIGNAVIRHGGRARAAISGAKPFSGHALRCPTCASWPGE